MTTNTYDDIKESIAPELARLHEAIHHTLKSSSNPLLNTVVESYLQSKGKLIRPILVIPHCEAVWRCLRQGHRVGLSCGDAPQCITDPRRCCRRIEDAPWSPT